MYACVCMLVHPSVCTWRSKNNLLLSSLSSSSESYVAPRTWTQVIILGIRCPDPLNRPVVSLVPVKSKKSVPSFSWIIRAYTISCFLLVFIAIIFPVLVLNLISKTIFNSASIFVLFLSLLEMPLALLTSCAARWVKQLAFTVPWKASKIGSNQRVLRENRKFFKKKGVVI